jgi:hypothetical protein
MSICSCASPTKDFHLYSLPGLRTSHVFSMPASSFWHIQNTCNLLPYGYGVVWLTCAWCLQVHSSRRECRDTVHACSKVRRHSHDTCSLRFPFPILRCTNQSTAQQWGRIQPWFFTQIAQRSKADRMVRGRSLDPHSSADALHAFWNHCRRCSGRGSTCIVHIRFRVHGTHVFASLVPSAIYRRLVCAETGARVSYGEILQC